MCGIIALVIHAGSHQRLLSLVCFLGSVLQPILWFGIVIVTSTGIWFGGTAARGLFYVACYKESRVLKLSGSTVFDPANTAQSAFGSGTVVICWVIRFRKRLRRCGSK
jgi:hypothetical protein